MAIVVVKDGRRRAHVALERCLDERVAMLLAGRAAEEEIAPELQRELAESCEAALAEEVSRARG